MKTSNLYFLALAILVSVIASCGKKAGTPKERLDGEWKIVNATGQFADMNKGTTYIFEGGTKFTSKLGIIETKGTISSISDSTFAVMYDGMQSEFNYSYHFDGDKLIIQLANSDQVFTLEEQ